MPRPSLISDYIVLYWERQLKVCIVKFTLGLINDVLSGAALHLYTYCLAWQAVSLTNQFSLSFNGERYIQICTGEGGDEQGDGVNEGLANLWVRKREKWSKVVNGKGKKNHTYSFTSDWRTSADRDQIEKATYPSPSLPLPLSQLKHRLCWRGHGVPAFQRKQPWGKTSLVLKKTPRKHRLDNNWGKPAFSCTSQMCQNSSACLTSSRIKQEMTPFPRHLFICCAGVDRKVGRTRQSTHLFPIISNKRQKSKLNKPEERAEERIRRLSRDGSSVNFKRQRGEFWGSTNKNDYYQL